MGLDPIFHLTKKLQLRFPFYIYDYFFENSTSATNTENLKINPNFFSKYFISNGIHLVYETALLPISIGINRYDALVYEKEEYNFFFKIGLSLENKMQLKKKRAGDRVRTGDIQLGRLTLYQLSYSRLILMLRSVNYFNISNILLWGEQDSNLRR